MACRSVNNAGRRLRSAVGWIDGRGADPVARHTAGEVSWSILGLDVVQPAYIAMYRLVCARPVVLHPLTPTVAIWVQL